MFARRSALVVSLAILVVGCSSGGGKQSTPTTARPLGLGPCPQTEPPIFGPGFNAGVKGLDKKLVPITAVKVRICRYGGGAFKLEAERTLVSSDAARFEAEVNQFAASIPTTLPPPPPNSPSGSQGLVGNEGCMQGWNHVVTFASDSQKVDIYADGCGAVGNGVLDAQSAAHWFNELQHYTNGFAEGEMHIQGGRPTKGRKPHDQPLPGVVEIQSPDRREWVRVGVTGRFKISLPAGTYVLVGRPSNKGIMAMKLKTFTIQDGRTVHVDLLELAT
jgi:hypothetical protein